MTSTSPSPSRFESLCSIAGTWWPLALSWLLMGVELPAISAVVARLPDQELQLAAFGGVVFPVSLLVEAPVIMLLAASTALSVNLEAFHVLKRFMVRIALAMTALHVVLAFTPLYDLVLVPLLDIPEGVVEPARRGLMIMTPWTWAIADRRTHQGLLIRFGQRSAVAIGTGVRLVATGSVLLVGWLLSAEGVVVASSALSVGTIAEALYARRRARPVIAGPLRDDPIGDRVVRGRALLRFYVPLAMTPLLVLSMQPLGTAGIDRMPNAVLSLAVWAPVSGLAFLCRSAGLAFNEVVIGHCGDGGREIGALRMFGWLVGSAFSAGLALIALTPLDGVWFEHVMGLEPRLVALGEATLWLAIPLPLLTFLQSLYQGILVDAHRTRYITESVVLFLLVTGAFIIGGVRHQPEYGVTAVLLAFTVGNIAQTAWLWHRCRTRIFRSGD